MTGVQDHAQDYSETRSDPVSVGPVVAASGLTSVLRCEACPRNL